MPVALGVMPTVIARKSGIRLSERATRIARPWSVYSIHSRLFRKLSIRTRNNSGLTRISSLLLSTFGGVADDSQFLSEVSCLNQIASSIIPSDRKYSYSIDHDGVKLRRTGR